MSANKAVTVLRSPSTAVEVSGLGVTSISGVVALRRRLPEQLGLSG